MQDARAAHTHTSALGHEELKEQTTTMVLNQEFLGEKCGGAVVVVMGVWGGGGWVVLRMPGWRIVGGLVENRGKLSAAANPLTRWLRCRQ